jgi:hypothetical protein
MLHQALETVKLGMTQLDPEYGAMGFTETLKTT